MYISKLAGLNQQNL